MFFFKGLGKKQTKPTNQETHPSFSQLFLIHHMLHLPDHFGGAALDLIRYVSAAF